jgi:hypothetical protein
VRKSRFSEEQIIAVLKESEAGVETGELCRRHGITRAIRRKDTDITERTRRKVGVNGWCVAGHTGRELEVIPAAQRPRILRTSHCAAVNVI